MVYTKNKKLLKDKNNFRKLKLVSEFYRNKYMDTRKNIKSLVNNEHKKYIQGIEQSVGNNINSFWNYVDKNSREGLVDLFKFNDQTIQVWLR